MCEYDDINKGADERYRRERYLCVRDTFARISPAATRPGGNTRPDERAGPNRRKMPSGMKAQEGDFSDDVHNGRDPSVLPSSGEEEVGVV